MLSSDNEAAAREEAARMSDPRVWHFYDPERRAGTIYAGTVFDGFGEEALASLPADHYLRSYLESIEDVPSEQVPLWDVAFFYAPGATWEDAPPKPTRWTKQFAFYAGATGDKTGLFWRNDFGKPPIDSDWFDEVRLLTGEARSSAGSEPRVALSESAAGCGNGAMRAKLIVLDVRESESDEALKALRAMKGVMYAEPVPDTHLVRVLGDTDSVTVERVLEFLRLAGYEATEATEEEYDVALKAMQAGGGSVVIRKLESDDSNAETGDFPETDAGGLPKDSIEAFHVVSLGDSIGPLKTRFNDEKDKPRFVALLSPT